MKRLITLLAAIAFAGQAWAEDFVVDGLKYTVVENYYNDSTHCVYVGKGEIEPEGELVIPSTIDYNGVTYLVVEISADAFKDCKEITSVNIPNTITWISSSAFEGCSGLISVDIPGSTWYIGDFAFAKCSSLTSVFIPNTMKYIAMYAFFCCVNLTSIEIPNSVKSIGFAAFEGCRSLTSIVIPNSVTSFGNCVFERCSGLTSVVIGDSVKSIGSSTFSDCESLTSVVIGDSVKSIGDYAFHNCTSLISVTIPESVTSIGMWAFKNCSNLTSFSIPKFITSIEDDTFNGCSNLTSITIPDSVKTIGNDAFKNCTSLTKVEFASIESLLEMKYGSMYANPLNYAKHLYINGTEVSELIIPNSIKSINDYAFFGCESLTSVVIGDSVKSIGNHAFHKCTRLTSVTIPESVTSIGEKAFYYSGLKSVEIPNSVTEIGKEAFRNAKNIVYSGNAEGRPWGALNDDGLIDGDFIYSDAGETKLTAYIGEGGDVVIPETVTSIGTDAFYYCSNITTITIPITVGSIGAYAFYGCTATIYCEASSKPYGWNYDWNSSGCPVVWTDHTPVTETTANAVNIYAYGKTIVIENATDEIRVYDAMGRLVCRDAARHVSTGTTTITINGAGVYIVKVCDVVKRVVVD